jgi:hypothetical protein
LKFSAKVRLFYELTITRKQEIINNKKYATVSQRLSIKKDKPLSPFGYFPQKEKDKGIGVYLLSFLEYMPCACFVTKLLITNFISHLLAVLSGICSWVASAV